MGDHGHAAPHAPAAGGKPGDAHGPDASREASAIPGHGHAHAHAHGHGHGEAAAPELLAPTVGQLVARARASLPPEVWDHFEGGAESETTIWRNRAALGARALRSRVLADAGLPSTATRLLGADIALPVVLSPIGVLDLVDPGGPLTAAQAAGDAGTLAFMGGVSLTSVDDVVAAGAPVAYQVYGRGDAGWLLERAQHARAIGCVALCITADVPAYGRRERDLRTGYLPKGRHRHAGAMGHPVTAAEVELVAARGGLPVVLKGVMTPEDARRALDLGVRCVYVSNHGGRQLDHAEATLDVLPRVAEAVDGRAEIVVDGGFRRGTDVAKALALGADAVAIGRLQAFALAAGGRRGLATALALLREELEVTMRLVGVDTVGALTPACLAPAPARPDDPGW